MVNRTFALHFSMECVACLLICANNLRRHIGYHVDYPISISLSLPLSSIINLIVSSELFVCSDSAAALPLHYLFCQPTLSLSLLGRAVASVFILKGMTNRGSISARMRLVSHSGCV